MQNKWDQLQRLERAGPVSTVLFGDSLLDVGADPSLLGVSGSVYNASLAGEPLSVLGAWATQVVVPRLHPSTVVLGFGINVLNSNVPGTVSLLKSFQRSRPVQVAEGKGDLVDRADWWLRQHVALYRERSVLRAPFNPPQSAATNTYDPPLSEMGWNQSAVGYGLGDSVTKGVAAVDEVRHSLLNDFAVGHANTAELARLIDSFRAKDIRVILVAMPVSPEYVQATPGGSREFEMALTGLLAVARDNGAQILAPGVWPQAYFVDAAHLNPPGTSRFTGWLSQQLGITPTSGLRATYRV